MFEFLDGLKGNDLRQAASEWLQANPVTVDTVPGTSTVDVAVGGDNYLASLDDQSLRVFADAGNDGTGDDLLFAGSATPTPEGVLISRDTNGDGVPDAEVATVSPELVTAALDLFLA